MNFKPDPMLAAAMIWTANPQSTEATPVIFPMVLESDTHIDEVCNGGEKTVSLHPTIHESRHLHFGEENMNVR